MKWLSLVFGSTFVLATSSALACDLRYYAPAVFDAASPRSNDAPPAAPIVDSLRLSRAGSLPGSCADIATLHIDIDAREARHVRAYGITVASGQAPAGLIPPHPFVADVRDGHALIDLRWIDDPKQTWHFALEIRAYSRTGVASKPTVPGNPLGAKQGDEH